MHTPPFRLARSPGTGHRAGPAGIDRLSADACCAPSDADIRSARRRTRLVELDPHLHCSVIGTCLTTGELRKLVPRFADVDRRQASDLEIHHTAVQLAIEGGPGGKALQKALDERFAATVRQFDKAKDADALLALWNDALKSGDIPPAYWAVMTHPCATLDVRQAVFGEVHMLSHLVGAANRADIRRPMALEDENTALKEKVERQQNRLHQMSTQHDASIRELTAQIDELRMQVERQRHAENTDLAAEVSTLREAVAARDERVALHTSRREAAEQRAQHEQDNAQTLRAGLDEALALIKVMQAESSAIEHTMQFSADEPDAPRAALPGLEGRRIVYVGGRPGSNAVLRRLVGSAGGELTVHDGGVEDRKGLLAAALPRADMVVFPVDCIDHDSMNTLKRVCERHQVAYYPLRTASVASFVELMVRVQAGRSAATAAAPASRFCLRHG
jgi:regulator of replication initiation timing